MLFNMKKKKQRNARPDAEDNVLLPGDWLESYTRVQAEGFEPAEIQFAVVNETGYNIRITREISMSDEVVRTVTHISGISGTELRTDAHRLSLSRTRAR